MEERIYNKFSNFHLFLCLYYINSYDFDDENLILIENINGKLNIEIFVVNIGLSSV